MDDFTVKCASGLLMFLGFLVSYMLGTLDRSGDKK